jgi:2-amino-4-hydroxy-6-hydroxymethyldihydropteridine diphosphokinase
MRVASGTTAQDGLPSWAIVSPVRAAHVERVVALLAEWAAALQLSPWDSARWTRAGWLHDALRDAPEPALRALLPACEDPLPLLHGPAAAARAAQAGEADQEVLEAVRWHTVGHPDWRALGRALYAADFLEPGRPFAQEERAELAAAFPAEPTRVLQQVVGVRTAHQSRRGRDEHPMRAAFRAVVVP